MRKYSAAKREGKRQQTETSGLLTLAASDNHQAPSQSGAEATTSAFHQQDVQISTSAVQLPTSTVQMPASAMQMPASAVQKPTSEVSKLDASADLFASSSDSEEANIEQWHSTPLKTTKAKELKCTSSGQIRWDKYDSVQLCACGSGKLFCSYCQDPLYRELYVYNDAKAKYVTLTRKYSRSSYILNAAFLPDHSSPTASSLNLSSELAETTTHGNVFD